MKNLELVYIIEDDDITSFIIKRILEEQGTVKQIMVFHNGLQALKSFGTESTWPDLILLDLNMPVMDGWEFLDAYDKLLNKRDIPVYILSSSIYPQDIEKSQAYPVVKGFLTKPLTASKLDEILKD